MRHHTPEKQRMIDWNRMPIELHIEHYSLFLEDDDFEKYQPLVYQHFNANSKDGDIKKAQRELVRALWIRSRFPMVGTIKHSFYQGLFNVEFQNLQAML